MTGSLWDYAGGLYGRPGVAAACLDLQDAHGIDVNLLLFAAWLGQVHGLALDAAGVQAAVDATSAWQSEVVVPIRGLRRALKALPQRAANPDVETVRDGVKALELDAERMEQRTLEGLRTRLSAAPGGAPGGELALANIALLLACRAVPTDPAAVDAVAVFRRALKAADDPAT
jgi:uncharacterized protein (TIGR02444 family)